MGIKIDIEPNPQIANPNIIGLKERVVFVQNGMLDLGHELMETTHPVVIDDTLGYSYKLQSDLVVMTSTYIKHGDKIYVFDIYETVDHDLRYWKEVEAVIDSIKFFD